MISFIVLAYNEEENLADTISTINAATKVSRIEQVDIVIVDDGDDLVGRIVSIRIESATALALYGRSAEERAASSH